MQAALVAAAFVLAGLAGCGDASRDAPLPPPVLDMQAAPGRSATAVFAGGCFWGVEAVFAHVRGVSTVMSGYAGGTADTATYDQVSSGRTEHAESVQVTFDPAVVSYGQLLRIFFSVVHDPTQRDRQGPDHGRQYRSAVFAVDDEQARVATAYIAQLEAAHAFPHPIATTVTSLPSFHPAEAEHQDFVARHPGAPYVVLNDLPKLARLRAQFPASVKAD